MELQTELETYEEHKDELLGTSEGKYVLEASGNRDLSKTSPEGA